MDPAMLFLPALIPALLILAFRSLCSLAPAPVPTYLKERHDCRC